MKKKIAACECGTCAACKARAESEANSGSALGALTRAGAKQSVRADSRIDSFAAIAESDLSNDPDGPIPMIILSEGLGNRSQLHFYGPECIPTLIPLLEGAKAFLDHSSESEKDDRPERTVRDLCGFYTNPRVVKVLNESGVLVTAAAADLVPDPVSEAGREVRALARHARLHAQVYPGAEEVYCGTSIDADGRVKETKRDVDGETMDVNYVMSFMKLRSADVVTRPARGGEFIRQLESIRETKMTNPQEALTMFTQAQLAELTAFGPMLESARGENDDKKAAKILREVRAKMKALDVAVGITEAEDEADGGKELLNLKKKHAALKVEHEDLKSKLAAHDAPPEEADGDGDEDDVPGGKKAAGEDEGKRMSASQRIFRKQQEQIESQGRELKQIKAREACREMLAKAEIPEDVLSVDELVSVSEAERPLFVKQSKRIALATESMRFTGVFPASGERGGAERTGDLKESLRKRGIPVLESAN